VIEKTDNSPELFAGYIPVVHDGYIRAFDRHPDARIGVFNKDILENIPYTRKDIRALNPEDAVQAISGLGREAFVMGQLSLQEALKRPIIMPEDDITRTLIIENPDADITTEPIFLRWDRDNSTEKQAILPDRIVRIDGDDSIIKMLDEEMNQSANWWRHVGSVVIDAENNIILRAHNNSLPTEYTSWIEGDPRITAHKGNEIDRSIDAHSEIVNIAEAARRGIALEGKSIMVTTFPCPYCAKAIAHSGIKSCYFIEGYATLDGQTTLKDAGVEIVKIETELPPEDPRSLKPYPNK
jgi:deoxycytidylate deaminase